MSLDRLYQLDPLSGTNNSVSNFAGANIQEGNAPSTLNNALRALGSMIAHEFHFQATAISSSVSTNLVTSATSWFVPVTGANPISSFGTVPGEFPSAAVLRFVQFSSSASLSNGTALRLIGGQSRRTQPGDIGGYVHVGSADVWHEFLYSRADGALPADSISVTTITNRSLSTSAVSTVTLNAASASITTIGITALSSLNSVSASVGEFTLLSAGGKPAVLFLGRATNSTYQTLGTIMPIDNTIPQNTEGNEVLSCTVTPTNASSTLKITFNGFVGGSSNQTVGAALFVDSTANALNATCAAIAGAGSINTGLTLVHYESAASTTQRVYRVRIGGGDSVDFFLNGDGTARQFGGVAAASLTVEEILP
jgi:hypothetical protein